MDFKLLRLAGLELTISLLMGVLILFLTYRVLVRVTHRHDVDEKDNPAFAVFAGAVLTSVGVLVSSCIAPLSSTFRFLIAASDDTLMVCGKFLAYLVGFFVLTSLIALLANAGGIALFCRLTHVDEFAEIRQRNVAVAIVTAVIILVLTLFVRDGVGLLLEALVPYPAVPGLPR